ncbi:MAG: exodeoxyribonuclease VII small subunit [Rhodospirillaceae bacterium]|nr:exodeoxyribonuclease VII small subunit [Rhodospirillaceae bacterium]
MSERDPEITTLSFEQAIAELEQIVRRLEAGEDDLDGAISAFERGAKLRAHCEAKLQDARMKVDKIMRDAEGSLTATPAEPS